MNRAIFLEKLKRFTLDATRDLLLPVRVQSAEETPSERPAEVHLMRLPDSEAAKKKAPYIIHQIITGKDVQKPGEQAACTTEIRSIFCVYCPDEEEGGMLLLNLMERLRIALLRQAVLDQRYQLDLEAGLEIILYPDDSAPYYAGEMASRWRLPGIEREVRP
ncbi:MAG TPA: hypothetical protein IAB89_09120 [Candidatus Caccousia avicola]|uniref:Uncharacterized protein n=1 Tax=Candidatus Caccousia avicola TaxID=2840721 RepID=A0A9D1ANP5_9FIRM|nr:hypothetical protein [Candidatus Caccousia avicola]